jgi:AcrR family transcriptional regulator
MSIVVEHEKRRQDILKKALDVFMDEGFEDATYQKIADRCAITRTTLYLYFKNKKEIFNYSIKQLLQEVENEITEVRKDSGLSHTEKMLKVMTVTLEKLEENRQLLTVVLNYLYYISKSDYDPDYRVRRRTVRMRHILVSMIIEGIRAGEFAKINVKDAAAALYSLLESAIFRLVVLRRSEVAELKKAAGLIVRGYAAP